MEYSGSRYRPCRLVLGSVGNGALGAKPGSETFDCASPISLPSQPPAPPPPPLDPATSTHPPGTGPLPLHPSPRARWYRDIISLGSLSARRAQVLSRLGTSFKLDTYSYEHNGVLGKYDSVIWYSLCRNRLRRTICRRFGDVCRLEERFLWRVSETMFTFDMGIFGKKFYDGNFVGMLWVFAFRVYLCLVFSGF